ncbi:anthrax toxin receptor 2-like isoform X3 [Zalophus californianus]|uniref:Anthrax toxin receptor 2-like isoform X3 n=1 Tax=Zalophus californianus TaxID=9704 RepID=A0A6J2D2X9_ZALCA|nr:anthrax toxin receptor 2-like isoform X3 [Zalophus californianus]
MGAKVYCVGVQDYRKDQLNDIVERKDQMYGIDNGFKSLEDIVNLLVVNSCHEVMAGESYFVCVRGEVTSASPQRSRSASSCPAAQRSTFHPTRSAFPSTAAAHGVDRKMS